MPWSLERRAVRVSALASQDTTARLIGRDAELDRIAAGIAAAARGVQHAVVVTGEAGIGKSALLGALREHAAGAGMLIVHGVGAEHEREVPFAAVVDALDDHVASIHARRLEALGPERVAELADVLPSVAGDTSAGEPFGGAAERFRYHRALRSLLGLLARERPVALVIDDLHWADEASAELVLHLLRRPLAGPFLIAVATRPSAASDRVVDALRHAGTAGTMLTLEPLALEDAEALVAGVADEALRRRVVRDAAGNPLFLHELARAGSERLPRTLLAAVRLELDALVPSARRLMEGAAVAGDPFDLGLAAIAAAMGESEARAALELLVSADLVRPDGAQLRFRHPLIRRAVYESAPAGERLAGHERADAELERRGAGAVQRAHNVVAFARPGDEEAVAILARAARTVRGQAPAAAARWFGAAVALLGPEAPARAGLQAELAGTLADAGELEPAHAALAALLAQRTLSDERRARLAAECAGLEQILGRHAEAQRRLERALSELPADAPATIRAALTFELAAAAAHREDLPTLVTVAGGASELLGDEAPALWVADQRTAALRSPTRRRASRPRYAAPSGWLSYWAASSPQPSTSTSATPSCTRRRTRTSRSCNSAGTRR